MSRNSSRGWRGEDRRDVSLSVGTSTTATASCASSSRRWVPSRVAVRRAEAIALRVGRTTRTGMSRAVSRWATDSRQVTAAAVWWRRHRRSWNAASAAAPPGSSRTCTLLTARPMSANASSTSARLSTSTLSRDRSWSPVMAARSRAAYRALPPSGTYVAGLRSTPACRA